MIESPDKPVSLLALEEAVCCCGNSQSELARRIGKTQGHISSWLNRGRCAAGSALAIETATGMRVSRHRLRPDVFGPEPVAGQPEEQAREAAE